MGWAGALQVVGGLLGNRSNQEAAAENRVLGKIQERTLLIQAEQAKERGAFEAMRARETGAGLVGAQKAGYAGGNVVVSDGSAAAVQADTARLAELDAQTIINNAALEAWGLRKQARFAAHGANNTAAGQVNAGYSSLLSGVAGAVSSYRPTAEQKQGGTNSKSGTAAEIGN